MTSRSALTLASAVASLIAFATLGAEPCEHAGAPPEAIAVTTQWLSPAVTIAHSHDWASAMTVRAMTLVVHQCCGGDGAPTCPSCPAGGACGAAGSAAGLVDESRAGVRSVASEAARCEVGRRPDSWTCSLDTPPPRD